MAIRGREARKMFPMGNGSLASIQRHQVPIAAVFGFKHHRVVRADQGAEAVL